MLNVNELTSRMAKMSDAQLRQYAQLHKNDPYTLALAASESKRRAQLRASGQPQAPQQPSVADQALAQMGAPAPMPQQAQPQPQPQLPEQQGIGMLPAQNVEGMADGGIAGYDDQFVDSYADAYAHGGIVAFAGNEGSLVGQGFRRDQIIPAPKTTFNQLVATQMKEASAKDLADEITRLENIIINTPSGPQRVFAEQRLAKLRGNAVAPPATVSADTRTYVDSSTVPPGWAVKGTKPGKRVVDKKGNVTFVPGEQSRAPKSINEYAGTDLSYNSPWSTAGATGPFANTPEGRAASAGRPGKEKKEEKGPSSTTPTGPAFTPTASTDLSTELAKVKPLFGDVGKKYEDLLKANQEFYTGFQKEREATRPKGKAFEGLEGLLKKEEEQAKGKEARNFNMAIVNAGLAIAGGRSQYALQNIAEGAQVGTKQYQEGLEKLEAAAIERRKQNAMIEEARRAEARGDWKEDLALKQAINSSNLAIRQNQIEGIAKITGDSIKVASDIVNTATQMHSADLRALMQQQEETKRAREQNITSKEVATIYANRPLGGGIGGAGRMSDRAFDNASKRHQLWLSSPEGKIASMTPGAADQKFLYFLDEANRALGITTNTAKDPYAGWGNLQVTPGKK